MNSLHSGPTLLDSPQPVRRASHGLGPVAPRLESASARLADRLREDPVMKRRTFIGVIACGLLAAPPAAEAQPAGKVPRVGMLFLANRVNEVVTGLEEGMTTLGYVKGRTVVYEHRFANWKPELLAGHAAE